MRTVRQWPVDTAAVAVVDGTGAVVGRHGPQDRPFRLASRTPPGWRSTGDDRVEVGRPRRLRRGVHRADLARFAAELQVPTLLAPQTLAEATQTAYPGMDGALPGYGMQRPNDWGLGFEELRAHKSPHWTGSRNSPETFGHFGRSGTFLWVDPKAGAACVALTDRDFDQWAKDAWPVFSDEVLAELA